MPDPLAKAFSHLDRWRHLPSYQLERRADVFFSVYLVEVLSKRLGVELLDVILPEFPIKLSLIHDASVSAQSKKVDYVLFSKDRARAFFVELKTDAGSRRLVQDDYLAKSKALGFRPIVEGVREILLATTDREKYHHLAHALSALGFLEMPAGLEELIFLRDRRAAAHIQEIKVPAFATSVEVVYLQPEATDGDTCVSFEEFASCLDEKTDALSVLFREHLRRWRMAAGAMRPSALR